MLCATKFSEQLHKNVLYLTEGEIVSVKLNQDKKNVTNQD